MDQNAKSQAIEQVKKAQNVLVTVSDNPSVDQLAAAIGFTLLLNKLNKHATAVFSGQIPSTIEFLKPEETLEGDTNSLRDFIISLDKNKADKLRYKVEDDVVRIYVTPYRTSISDKDLTFSQGDYNVDVVLALGVYNQDQLDKAIQDHGRILHDAAIVSVIAGTDPGDIGGINWNDKNASSLCEMLMGISESLKPGILDEQIATALLTGIVAETDRFSNEKTTPKAMTMSAQLMSAGANQQLISDALEPEPEPVAEAAPESDTQDAQKPDYEEASGPSLADIQPEEQPQEESEEDGVLNLRHDQEDQTAQEPEEVQDHHIGIDEEGQFANAEQLREAVDDVQGQGSFKGKTIVPPEDYEPGSQLPRLDGEPSYTPGSVSYAPTSAVDGEEHPYENPAQPPVSETQPQAPNEMPQPPQSDGYDRQQAQAANDDGQQPDAPSLAPAEPPMSQGQPYLDPAAVAGQHGEDSLTEEEAQKLVKSKEPEFHETPVVQPEHKHSEFLDHPPSTDPGDSGLTDQDEKPSIEQGREKFSRYLDEPPADEPKLNAQEGVEKEETVDPLSKDIKPSEEKKKQEEAPREDPWLSTQHDAESVRANSVPETKHPRLYDDGVGVSTKRLGAPVGDYNTLDEIEHSVEEVAGKVHGHTADDARKQVQDAVASGPPQENPLQYLNLDSDPQNGKGKSGDQPAEQPADDSPPPAPPPIMPPQ